MPRDFLTALLTLVVVAASAGAARFVAVSRQAPANQTPTNQTPGNQTPIDPTSTNQTPTNASPPTPSDPAAVIFTTETGLMLHAVKPANTADYEAVIVALQEVLAQSEDPDIRALAAGWVVFKAGEGDVKGGALYVHMLQPTVAGVDYRPSQWLDKLLSGAPPELLAKYRDSFAIAPSKLSLTEFARMSVVPVKPANATPDEPAKNATPDGPAKNGSPAKPAGGLR